MPAARTAAFVPPNSAMEQVTGQLAGKPAVGEKQVTTQLLNARHRMLDEIPQYVRAELRNVHRQATKQHVGYVVHPRVCLLAEREQTGDQPAYECDGRIGAERAGAHQVLCKGARIRMLGKAELLQEGRVFDDLLPTLLDVALRLDPGWWERAQRQREQNPKVRVASDRNA